MAEIKIKATSSGQVTLKPPPRPNKHWVRDSMWIDLMETANLNAKNLIDKNQKLTKKNITTRFEDPKKVLRKWPGINEVIDMKLVDNATDTTLTYENFDKFIDKNKPGDMSFNEMADQWKIKRFINENPTVKYALQDVLWPGKKMTGLHTPGHIHHLAQRKNNAYNR